MHRTPFVFRINENGTGPNLLLQVCLERGWEEYSEENPPGRDRWNLWWRTSGFSVQQSKALKNWQFTNHIPRGSVICRKDNLLRYLRVMKSTYGNIYDFSPEGFILPVDYSKLVEQCSRSRAGCQESSGGVWICKPVSQSQGRGISLFRNVSELSYDTNSVVQKYIQNPLLIGGYKFDLRLYVCVPSFRPLTVYLYREGLARFSTSKYSMRDISDRYAHLTNSAINRQGPGYLEMKDKVGAGCKWSLRQLRHYLLQSGTEDWLLWQRIAALVGLTVAGQAGSVPPSHNCFEFYGFDILIDSDLKPWLLEVNLSPALGTDCDIDPAVKKPMLHDLFDLIGLPVGNTGLFKSLGNLFDRTEEEREGGQESRPQPLAPPSNTSAKTVANVVSIACKWKNHRNKGYKSRPLSCSNIKVKPLREARFNLRNKLAMKNINHEDFKDDLKTTKDERRSDREEERARGALWESGVDWRQPVAVTGDWVRVYPLSGSSRPATPPAASPLIAQRGGELGRGSRDSETRTAVAGLSRLARQAREVQALHPGSSDETKDRLLTSLTEVVWHPAPGFHEDIS